MYRQVFTSTVGNLLINIPESWYGQPVEVIAFPLLDMSQTIAKKSPSYNSRKKREAMNKRYSMDLSGFKFNREEANDYE